MTSSYRRRLAWIDPGLALRCFADDPDLVFFDSGGPAGARSRRSYLCVWPFRLLIVRDGVAFLDGVAMDGDAFSVLAQELARHRAAPADVPFAGGAAGFIGYDMGAALDRAPRAPGECACIPDMKFGFFDTVLAFDHWERDVWIYAPTEAAAGRAEALLSRACDGSWDGAPGLAWRALVGHETHMARVRRVKRYIEAGDIYQANIAAVFEADRPAGLCPVAMFSVLRAVNPAPFGAYVACGDGCAILSVSPERFLRLTADGGIEARPIKGTRPRGRDAAEDAALRAELVESAKDRAENLMIVDLLRNDMSRVAEGVHVPSLFEVESFAHVHHLVSAVRGRIRAGLGAVDLLRAAFPGGSITGAPKLRAMEIIAELEGRARGPYCGCAAWIGFDGAMDSNILIRTMTVAKDRVVAQAGGGIVADSDPAAEWEEVLVKIMPLLRATGAA